MRKFKPQFRRHTALLQFLLHFAVRLIPGLVYEVQGLGRMVTVDPPAFAVLPLIFIGFCRSPQGVSSKVFRVCWDFLEIMPEKVAKNLPALDERKIC